MTDASDFPPHLRITAETVARLQSGWTTDNALVGGLAELEAFVRTQPDDHPGIITDSLEEFPVTKQVVASIDNVSKATAGKITYGGAAVVHLGFVITALKSLEAHNQQLARRIAVLERR